LTDQHPITLPSELVHEWVDMLSHRSDYAVFSLAAQWGADQELDACCELLKADGYKGKAIDLRASRRPKPPTLKEQALEALHAIAAGANDIREQHQDLEVLRRALEALPND